MTTVESRVRQQFQQYATAFVNTRMLLSDETTKHKTYLHALGWICERYRNEHKPSQLEWNMGGCREVTAAVQLCVEELVGEKR